MKPLPNKEYWSQIAPYYETLYTDGYSQLENDAVKEALARPYHTGEILDVACGTGLGVSLLPPPVTSRYTGCDISPGMIVQARARYPELFFDVCAAESLSYYASGFFDGLISLFTSFSYFTDPAEAVKEFARVLKPGAPIYIMAINRYALWRMLARSTPEQALYQTRHIESCTGVMTTFYTPKSLKALFNPYFDCSITGLSLLGNVWELPVLWGLDRRLSRLLPALCHNLILQGVKRA